MAENSMTSANWSSWLTPMPPKLTNDRRCPSGLCRFRFDKLEMLIDLPQVWAGSLIRWQTPTRLHQMKTDLLEKCGAALYGPCWQSELARALGVSDQTMCRWVAGDSIHDGVGPDLLRLVLERGRQLDDLIEPLIGIEDNTMPLSYETNLKLLWNGMAKACDDDQP